jgi:1,4-dihydroxy-2-naphthoate octaprenyltransferase
MAGTTASRGVFATTISPYARLAKLGVYQHWLPVVVAWAVTPVAAADSSRGLLTLVLFWLSLVALAAAGAALDDVQGIRDGIDRATYKPEESLRRIKRKPLLLDELTEHQAEQFGRGLAVGGAALGVAAVIVAPYHPWYVGALFLAGGLAGVQYAYGLKFSYLGGGEILIGLVTGGSIAVPCMMVSGQLPTDVLLVSILVGVWFIQVTAFSNTADAPEDVKFDRRTFATRFTLTQNRIYITSWFALSFAVAAAGLATGELPGWLAVAMIPCWALQVGQLVTGVGEQRWLLARMLGWRAYDAGCLAIIAVYAVEGRL